MYMTEHQASNTLYCVHGRHGSQTIRRLSQSTPGFVDIENGKIEDSVVMSDHYKGKIRTITRDPWEKFQSGLSWYIARLTTHNFEKSQEYDTMKHIIRSIVGSTINSTGREISRSEIFLENFFMSPMLDIQRRDHFDYTLHESHLCFTNLSMVFLVALGLDVEVIDITNIHTIYPDFGFTAPNTNVQGKYVMDDSKEKYYSNITEIYLDTLDELMNDTWFSGYYQASSQEFKELMSWEYRAYNALNSDNMVEECRNFLLDLLKGMLDKNSKIEISYLIQCRNAGSLTAKILYRIPYKSELYPVVCLFSHLMDRFTPGTWQDYLQDCEKLISKPYS